MAAKLTTVQVSLRIPFTGISIGGTWEPDESQRKAAWEMYVELVTRVAMVELGPDEGLLREALSSLYALFDITRQILRSYGPAVAQPKGEGDLSFGRLAVFILNDLLRPILAPWHPRLLEFEATRAPGVSAAEHERRWPEAARLHETLQEAQQVLGQYADILAAVAGVPPLHAQLAHNDPIS
jgi:hypothetical protein